MLPCLVSYNLFLLFHKTTARLWEDAIGPSARHSEFRQNTNGVHVSDDSTAFPPQNGQGLSLIGFIAPPIILIGFIAPPTRLTTVSFGGIFSKQPLESDFFSE
jgi:hypothetical protein